MPRHAKRTDKSQAQIVADLRKAGVQVIITNFGDDYPDLLLCAGQQIGWVLAEVKNLGGRFVLSQGQLRFLSEARGYVGVVTDFQEAYTLALKPDKFALQTYQKTRIAQWLLQNPDQESLYVPKFFKLVKGEL